MRHPSSEQIGGLLLEEVILRLLHSCGYQTVTSALGDPTLAVERGVLVLRGRGSTHQIDAIADFAVHHPFSNPQRLLVEAKFWKRRVGLDVARNALGVLRDVTEYWVSNAPTDADGTHHRMGRSRYHYQYAIFSASEFSKPAQDFAFAQDIFLLPLARSSYLKQVLDAITEYARCLQADQTVNLKELRRTVRGLLTDDYFPDDLDMSETRKAESKLLEAVRRIGSALLAMLGNRFPVFLVPNPNQNVPVAFPHDGRVTVRIYRDDAGWYLRSAESDQLLFSFDLPSDLIASYLDEGMLTPESATVLKGEWLSRFQAFQMIGNRISLITFELDQGWLEEVRHGLERQP